MIPTPNRSFQSTLGRVWLLFSVVSFSGVVNAQTKQLPAPAGPPATGST